MRGFFLMGCGGSKFTVLEDDLGLPYKKDTRQREEISLNQENETTMDDNPNNDSHIKDNNGLKEMTTMSLQKDQPPHVTEIPTYEVKFINNQLVQQVTMTIVTVKDTTTIDQGNQDSDYNNDDYEYGSLISNSNNEYFIGSPSFREYCNTNDSNSKGVEDKELADNKIQITKNDIAISHELDEISNKDNIETKNDSMVPQDNEDVRKSVSNREWRGINLGKVFPIHKIQVAKLSNIHKKDS